MAETLYATFADNALAEKAVGALLDYGVRQEDISLIMKQPDAHDRKENNDEVRDSEDRANWTEDRDRANWTDNDRVVPTGSTVADPNYSNDQTRFTDAGVTPATTVVNDPNANYQMAAEDRAWGTDVEDNRTYTHDDHAKHEHAHDIQAKQGISTTTPADAGVGAAKGAGIGLGVGILAAVASVMIPGFGLVVGGGALATAIAGAVGTTVAGAVAGGAYGYLKDQGMPEHIAAEYNKQYEAGQTIFAVQVPSNNVDRVTVEQVLGKYGASNVNTFPATYAKAA